MLQLSTRFALVLMTLLCLYACSNEQPGAGRGPVTAEKPLRIVTTINPITLIVRDLVDPSLRDLVEVSTLMLPDVSPHGFEPTPSQMARLRSADIVIYNGLGLDDWAARDLPRSTVSLRFADALGDEADHHHHHHHHHDHECDHDHGPIDEHFWLDVELVKTFAGMCIAEIGRHLGGSEAHESLQSSFAAFVQTADEVDAAFRDLLSKHQQRRLVTHHNVFSRIAERYGLGDPIVLRPVEMLEPTPGDIRRAIEAIRTESISFILVEPQFSVTAAQRIADETQVRLIQVDPLGGDAATWAGMMHLLLEAMGEGLGTGQ